MGNKNEKINSRSLGETVLADQRYDGFIPFALDGRDQNRYSYFRTGLWIIVQPDEYAIVIDKLNPSPDKISLLEPGFYPSNPITEKYIYVPNPYGPVVIDFSPTDDQDRKENFTFTPNAAKKSSSNDAGEVTQDEIYIDYKVEVRLISPIRYFYSRNVIFNLKKAIVTVLKNYVASKDKNELFAADKLDLNEVDKSGTLKSFRSKYGLDVVSLGISNVKLSEAVQTAKNETAVAKEGIKKAQYEYEAAKIKAKSSEVGFETMLDLAFKKGLNPEQAVSIVDSYAKVEIAKNPNANIFLNTASNSQFDPNMVLALIGGAAGKKFIRHEDKKDEDLENENVSEEEDVIVKKRKK